ncbi:YdaS family helix-turn-helix protein [Bacillus sp. V5-8f]|uniref:YdaS family helix-turn-helix protein n=1 Tax=Bacillus sp. V5-8f TaxID=2053044 RepID=UPI000C7633E1|nr:YdaS family helix-turn-helix protein [Bacillus sp. V5-8f]PLT32528.1 hypothetical protein CUU64_18660 [Bacillus sp. V5-8f]
MIGLEKILEVFNKNANQLASEIGVSRQTVYDWIKQKRKIPAQRLEQLHQISEFKYLNKELFQKNIDKIDTYDIELAYINHLSEKDTVVKEDDFYGIEYYNDPHEWQKHYILEMQKRKLELKKADSFLTIELEGFEHGEQQDLYFNVLKNINKLFNQGSNEHITLLQDLLNLITRSDTVVDLTPFLDVLNEKMRNG